MGQDPYQYTRRLSFRYTFVSKGKTRIEKLVVFAPTPVKNIFNLGFGDLLDDGTIDDTANSNNGDLIKVLATVIQILKEFTREYPYAKVVFSGSTPARTALYRRILKAYYPTFSKEFIISALVEAPTGFCEVPFDHSAKEKYLAFFVQRIN